MDVGVETGKYDDRGRMIKNGDRVEYHQYKQPYRDTYTQDGDVPARRQKTKGTVVYSPRTTEFIVNFDDYLLESGNRESSLYMLGKHINAPKDRLIVIGS